MKFVLLGGDDALLPLLAAIESHPHHRLVAAASVSDDFAASLLKANPAVRRVVAWEELLNVEFDAVIAVAGNEDREAGIKQLATIGKPLLLVPTGDPTSAFVYELTLVRDDTRGVLSPLFPLRCLPVIEAVRSALHAGRWGRVLNLQWNRRVSAEASLMPRSALHENLIHDADLLRRLGGDYRQVTAVLSGASAQQLSLATVTLAGENLPTALWTIRPVTEQAGWELIATTEQGSLTLHGDFPAGHSPDNQHPACRVTASGLDISEFTQSEEPSVAARVLRRFETAAENANDPSSWQDLTRATEIVEAAERSLRRRRTIDLHFETTSERNQFKTQMTAIGCGLMSMTFVSVLFLLMAGALFKPHPLIMKIAQVGIVVPLVLFLLLQLLLFIARPSAANPTEAPDSGPSSPPAE